MIWKNHMLLAALLAWALAQLIKTVLTAIQKKRFVPERLIGSGGMPSSHTALVTALVLSVGRHAGFDSAAFAIAACFALVTMYDATGVRHAAGEQAKILNYMMDNWSNAPEFFNKNLKELLGHTPKEVIGGAVLGCITGLLV